MTWRKFSFSLTRGNPVRFPRVDLPFLSTSTPAQWKQVQSKYTILMTLFTGGVVTMLCYVNVTPTVAQYKETLFSPLTPTVSDVHKILFHFH